MRLRVAAVVALALVVACQGAAVQPSEGYRLADERPAASAATGTGLDLAARASNEAVVSAPELGLMLPGATDVLPNLVIRTGTASIEVDSLERAIALARALAHRVGGFVAGSAAQTGKGQLHSASLEIRMPADRFDDAVDGLRPLGKVEAVNVSAQDVGEEYVDVEARMTNARRLEARLIEPIPVVNTGAPRVVAEAVRQAWRNFIALVAMVIQSLGVILPLGVVAGAGWWVVRRARKPAPPRPVQA